MAGWRAGRHFHSEITEHCMDHRILRIPFCDSGPNTSFQSWSKCIWLLYQNLYIYTLTLGFKFSKKRHRTCWKKAPQEHVTKTTRFALARRARLLLSSNSQWFWPQVSKQPCWGLNLHPNENAHVTQNRDHFKKDMSSSNQENFRGYDMLVIRGVIPFFWL